MIQELYKEAYGLPAVSQALSFKPALYNELEEGKQFFGVEYLENYPEPKYLIQKSFIQMVLKEYSKTKDFQKISSWTKIEQYYDWVYHRQFAFYKARGLYDFDKFISEKTAYHSYRDSIMSIIFTEHYKQKKEVKAVAIMSAYHALNDFRIYPDIENYVDKNTHVLHEMLDQSIKDSIYSICFVAGSGSVGTEIDGRRFILDKVKPVKHSIENYFQKKEHINYFFTDFKTDSIKTSFPAAIIFNKTVFANWTKIYSGLIFIRKMYPTKFIVPKTGYTKYN